MSHSTIYPLLYAAPISYYAQWLKQPGIIEAKESFIKQTFRSRCKVYGANGVIVLSIPVQSHAQKQVVSEVHISNIDAWQRNHWRTLESAYKSSPFFEYYAYLLEPLYITQYDSLWQFNLDMHQIILQCLQWEFSPAFTSNFDPITEKDLRAVYSSKKSHPLSAQFPIYQQVFSYQGNFEPDLSILDALFNLGPETEDYLQALPF